MGARKRLWRRPPRRRGGPQGRRVRAGAAHRIERPNLL